MERKKELSNVEAENSFVVRFVAKLWSAVNINAKRSAMKVHANRVRRIHSELSSVHVEETISRAFLVRKEKFAQILFQFVKILAKNSYPVVDINAKRNVIMMNAKDVMS